MLHDLRADVSQEHAIACKVGQVNKTVASVNEVLQRPFSLDISTRHEVVLYHIVKQGSLTKLTKA